MKTFMEKLKNVSARLAEEFGKDVADRDDDKIAALLDEQAKLVDSEKSDGGYAGSRELDALAAQIKQVQADHEKTVEQLHKLQKLGLNTQERRVELDYRDVMALRRVRKVFRHKEDAESFGALAARSIYGNSPIYNDLVHERTRGMADELVKAYDPGVSGSGAELVANVYMADLIAHVEAVGVLFVRCDRVPLTTTGTSTWPKLTGEMTAYPTAVAAKIAESYATLETVTLSPIKWGTLGAIPNEFFRDPSMLDQLGQRVAWMSTRAIAYAADNCMVNGDGTADYGTITGLLQDTSLTAVTAGAATDIASYTGAEIGAIIAAVTKDYVEDPYWMMHLSSERTLRNIRSTVGTPLYLRGNNGEPNTIDDYPYTTCQRFTAAGSVGAAEKWCAFGDLRLSHYFGMLGSIQIAQSDQVRFEHDVTMIRGLAHFDAAVKDANAVVIGKTHA